MSRKRKPTPDELKFISENQKLSGFSGHISPETAAHEIDLDEIAKAAPHLQAQTPEAQIDRLPLEDRVRDALSSPDEETTLEEHHRRLDEIAKEEGYLHASHREHSERLKQRLSAIRIIWLKALGLVIPAGASKIRKFWLKSCLVPLRSLMNPYSATLARFLLGLLSFRPSGS